MIELLTDLKDVFKKHKVEILSLPNYIEDSYVGEDLYFSIDKKIYETTIHEIFKNIKI